MLQLNNRTPFVCSLAIFPNEDGIDSAYGIAKATFELGSKSPQLAAVQSPLVAADEFWGDPQQTSLKRAAEVGLSKPGTDILLLGHAYAPNGSGSVGEVRLNVGHQQKTVSVFGNRIWDSGLFGLKISPPELFQKLPLKYELSFGGTDRDPEDPSRAEFEPRNPVGRGLLPKKSRLPKKGQPLPNFEDPTHLIKGASDRPAPAGFGPICAHWEPRKSFAGTYDAVWQKKRAPYLPKDFNRKFHQTAPPDLISPSPLKGGEPVEIAGAAPGAPMQFSLPLCTVEMVFHLDGQPTTTRAEMDMVCFEPDEHRMTIVWRASHVVDKKLPKLRELEIRCREFPRSAVHTHHAG